MQITGHITADNLMGLEAYSKFRKTHKAEVLAHRKLRSVHLGEHITLQFESEMTIRYQIQEMLKMIPDTTINTVERCSGHAGTYGVKKPRMLMR